jgi:hypothetical protein
MKNIKDIIANFKFTSLRRSLFTIYIPSLVFLLLIFIIGLNVGIPIEDFTRDPNAVTEVNPFIGAVSQVGLFLWSFTAAVCLFMVYIARKQKNKRIKNFFLFSAVITLVLLLDDAFLLHEVVFPDYLAISQKVVYGSYVLLIAYYLFSQRNVIFKTNLAVLFIAFTFFGLSVFFDVAVKTIPHQTLYEDGFKLLGIVSWLIYFVKTSRGYYNSVKNTSRININLPAA